MAGTVNIHNIAVIMGTLVRIAHLQRDGSSCGPSPEHAGQDFHLVPFLSGRGKLALARLSPVQIGLDVPSSRGSPAGQPSTTTPIPFPWDSPQVVTLNLFPNDDWLICFKSFLAITFYIVCTCLKYTYDFIIAKCKSFVNRKHWN